MDEIWKDIAGYEDKYQISSKGRILNKQTGQMSKAKPDKSGYVKCNLYINGKNNMTHVHRLVANAFIPNPNNLPMVHHKDGNKANNAVENLEWVSPKEHGKAMLPEQRKKLGESMKKNRKKRIYGMESHIVSIV